MNIIFRNFSCLGNTKKAEGFQFLPMSKLSKGNVADLRANEIQIIQNSIIQQCSDHFCPSPLALKRQKSWLINKVIQLSNDNDKAYVNLLQ